LVLTQIIDEDHASYKGTSEVVDVIVDYGTPLDVDTHAHDISESSVFNQIFSIHLSHL